MAGDLSTTVSLLRRMINYHDSWIHRLPPKILAMMASHLEDDTSLVAATHVRHLWRTALLSSPRLWSHLDFDNEKRALAFLERSKFGPVTVDFTESRKLLEVARGTLKEITSRVTILQVSHDSFLDELLAQPMSGLQALEIIDSDRLWPEKPAHLPLINPGLPLHFYIPGAAQIQKLQDTDTRRIQYHDFP